MFEMTDEERNKLFEEVESKMDDETKTMLERDRNERRSIEAKMEENKTAQPQLGTWDNLPTEESERRPKVPLEMNAPVVVTFLKDSPVELNGENGVYYLFDVIQGEEEKVIMTSAWSLLRGLKLLHPLSNKKVRIERKIEKGKQFYEAKLSE